MFLPAKMGPHGFSEAEIRTGYAIPTCYDSGGFDAIRNEVWFDYCDDTITIELTHGEAVRSWMSYSPNLGHFTAYSEWTYRG